jgi:hypothetical protein
MVNFITPFSLSHHAPAPPKAVKDAPAIAEFRMKLRLFIT